MIDWFSFVAGAAVLWCCQGLYRMGREHGAISDHVDARNKEYLHTVIRHSPREQRADISEAINRDRWSN